MFNIRFLFAYGIVLLGPRLVKGRLWLGSRHNVLCYNHVLPGWRYRLGVRTEDSQSSNPGSIPGSATNYHPPKPAKSESFVFAPHLKSRSRGTLLKGRKTHARLRAVARLADRHDRRDAGRVEATECQVSDAGGRAHCAIEAKN